MAQDKKQGMEELAYPTPAKTNDAGQRNEATASELSPEAKPVKRYVRKRAVPPQNKKFVLPRMDGEKIQIEKEYPTEQEAVLDSYKLGRPYWVIEQYTAYADMGGKNLVIKKKPSDNELQQSVKLGSASIR